MCNASIIFVVSTFAYVNFMISRLLILEMHFSLHFVCARSRFSSNLPGTLLLHAAAIEENALTMKISNRRVSKLLCSNCIDILVVQCCLRLGLACPQFPFSE